MPLVHPVPGYYIAGVPHMAHECDGDGFHHLCLASGAFTEEPPPEVPADRDEDPAGAGSLDSEQE